MLPRLDLDEHTAALFPPEAHEGRAQAIITFKSPESGEERKLFARLALHNADALNRFGRWRVVLRPIDAEPQRIFITQPHLPRVSIPASRTVWKDERDFDWQLYEQCLNADNVRARIRRIWKVRESDSFVFSLKSDGKGRAVWIDEPYSKQCLLMWKKHTPRGAENDVAFLDCSTDAFRRGMMRRYQKEQSELPFVERWHDLSPEGKEAIAFSCSNGIWDQLRYIAKQAVTVWSAHAGRENASRYELHKIIGSGIFERDALAAWRSALVSHFRPNYFPDQGFARRTPLCIKDYINYHKLNLINLEPPTHHELIEARFQLERWARQHLPADEAERLLAL